MQLTEAEMGIIPFTQPPVIFGEKGDSTLLGTVSLETLGFILDPIKRVLRSLPIVLG
jgi:hypothetical protein